MDAKVLRAAVSAAIRVTVSTTLIGCGGNVTSAGGGAQGTPAAKENPAKATDPVTNDNDTAKSPPATAGNGWTWSPSSGGQVSTGGGSGGNVAVATVGGSPEGGSAEGGEGNGTPLAQPLDTCDALNSCLTDLEASMPAAPLKDANQACCEAMIDHLKEHQVAMAEACWADLNGRLMSSAARNLCCNSPETWQVSACTPWGPPVPPELSEAALAAWEAAA